jgi:hypothetical protein
MSLPKWLPRYEKILALLRKLRPLLPNREKDELLFNIISYFGEGYAASKGPHPNLPPYELEDPMDNLPFPVNYRSAERLEQMISGINEIANWMQMYLDAKVDEIEPSELEDMPSAVWLIGYELPRLYELFFGRFGVSVSRKKSGPGIRFIIHVLDTAEITTGFGKAFSPQTIRTYRRRARQMLKHKS